MKAYYNQEKISSSLRDFFKFFSISKPCLKSLSYIITGMISAESVVTSDISRKLKVSFPLIHLESIERKFRRFFNSFSSFAYSFDLIKNGISFCANLFANKNYHIIFLADRWFPYIEILSHIQSLDCFYCIRSKSFFTFSYYDSKGFFRTSHLRDIKPIVQHSKILNDVLFTRKLFKTNIVVSNSSTDDPWYLVTNDDPRRAIKNYSHRFGSIECIFKSQKSNGFRLESTNTQKIEHFISLFTVMCIALVWLTIIGVDYCKNKNHYSKYLKIRDTYKKKNSTPSRFSSYFNLGLTIFNRCYYNYINFTLKFDFVLYDI